MISLAWPDYSRYAEHAEVRPRQTSSNITVPVKTYMYKYSV